jgi:hypothetical protein
MYLALLHTHNVLRWIVLLAAVFALAYMLRGWLGKRPWTQADMRVGSLFTVAMDVQLLVGILLYVVSPLVQSALRDFGAAMGVHELRFFALEHALLMLVAVVLVHIGTSRAKKRASHRPATILYSLALAAMLFAIPWWRPLFPGL